MSRITVISNKMGINSLNEIHLLEGTINQFSGDDAMAVFGARAPKWSMKIMPGAPAPVQHGEY